MTNEQTEILLSSYIVRLIDAIAYAKDNISDDSKRVSEKYIDGVVWGKLSSGVRTSIMVSGGIETVDKKRITFENTGDFVALQKLQNLVECIETDCKILRKKGF